MRISEFFYAVRYVISMERENVDISLFMSVKLGRQLGSTDLKLKT